MKLTDNFGPIPLTATINASGTATVTFQPNGKNARITTLFVKASTSTLQATVNIYKGQVSDYNIIGSTPSGSTGAPAFGNIDLQDGETLYVVWTGGDVGATATATFVGHTIPFEQIGGSELRWSDPIAANDGSLVFPAIKSPNYVAGSAGWKIARDGSVEFNNATVRGSLIAGSGAVTLNASGLHINGATQQFDINGSAGFLARMLADDGSAVTMQISGGTVNGGTVFFTPVTPTAVNHTTMVAGYVHADTSTSGAADTPSLTINSPNCSGKEVAQILLTGQVSNSATDNSVVQLDAATINVAQGDFTIHNIDGGRGWFHNDGTNVDSAAIGATETTVFTINLKTYKANRAYCIDIDGFFTVSVGPDRPTFRVRKDTLTTPPTGTSICIHTVAAIDTTRHSLSWRGVFTVGASDVSTPLVFTALGAGGFNVTTLGTPPLYCNIYDIGSASTHTIEPVLP